MAQTSTKFDLFPSSLPEYKTYESFVDVALGIPQDEPYQYAVPKKMIPQIGIGYRVKVPLGRQTRFGYIVGIGSEPISAEVKPILEVVDQESLISDSLLELTKWMSEYYFCSWGMAIEAIMPAPFKRGRTKMRGRKTKAEMENQEDALLHATPIHQLTDEQSSAVKSIRQVLKEDKAGDFLLHGVTGSGKTEVYMNLIDELLQEGKGAIVLVPEISLTPQTTERFKSRFGDVVAIMHSRLSAGKRLEEWHKIREGKARIVVGARSAVFSPIQNLKLIIIDEEHDDSYKQEETPRYLAYEVASKRCELEKAVLVRASATPLLESFYGAKEKSIQYLGLPNRIEKRPMPEVQIIDMRNEKAGKNIRIFSIPLENAINKALDQNEQIMLLMNRRGFAPCVSCAKCGYVAKCPRCRVSLVYHHERQKIVCHVCDYSDDPPKYCPACDKGYLNFWGIGTEKVEAEAKRLFPQARIARMDRDATMKKDSHEKLLASFRKREIDILLGTQMIAKGHDFPGVSVIGVISADTALNLPDFRSAERTFNLLTQVAGRAGRDKIKGNVFVQSLLPKHYAIALSKEHDYEGFYQKEIKFRQELKMPPFSNLIQIIFSGKIERDVLRKSLEFKNHAGHILEDQGIAFLGPAPCVVSKRYGQYFWNVFLKVKDVLKTHDLLRGLIKSFDKKSVKVIVNVNPR